jgi:uncharacterized iron-regulated protein
MAATSRIRLRRSAAQMHALAQVEREIRASDPALRRKYLREFNFAFQTYERVLSRTELDERLLRSDVILVGDYHALPASQAYAAQVVEQLAARSGRPLILGVETVFSRDQHILDEWQAGQIDELELRERIRYDLDWGYDWQPFYRLLSRAKAAGARIHGLDCMPRGDLRRISARDRHAADKLALLQEANPTAQFVVLFGESHLAPQHLPELVKEKLLLRDVLTVLQNVDSLYWRAAGEPDEQVEAVTLTDDVVCVFNSTPLEKYESYRQCIERWRRERPGAIDLAPTFYNLIDALLRFMNVDKYSPKSIHHPSFLVDLLPEVYSLNSRETLRNLLQRKGATDAELRQVLTGTDCSGAAYLPRLNAVFVTRFELLSGAEEATRFVHAALRGAVGTGMRPPLPTEPIATDDAGDDPFYAAVLERALAYFGSRVLYPARAAIREVDLFALYAQTSDQIEEQTYFNYRDYMQMIDFLVMHKDFESNARSYFEVPELIEQGRNYSDEQLEFVVEKLGGMLGSELYDAYLAGKVHKRYIRSLFFRDLRKPGVAHTLYFVIARRLNPARKRVF